MTRRSLTRATTMDFWCAFRLIHAISLFLVCSVFQASYSTASVFPDRTQPPGLNSTYKAWWAKEITPDLHISGRLTDRQIKYASEAGFKSIVSLFTYPEGDSGEFGVDYLPTTEEAKHIVEKVAGMQFVNLLGDEDDWASVEAVQKISAVLSTLKTPILLHCNRGYTITFVTLMHLANQTRLNPNFSPKIKSKEFYEIAAAMGLDFTMDYTREIVAEITGEPIVEDPVKPNADPEEWLDYWVTHPVYRNWFCSGQILHSHIQVMEDTGFKAVVNVRTGIQFNGAPSQEEVNLLNIKERTGTYATAEREPRQSLSRLEETRINPDLPPSYISPHAPVNFEMQNPEEFGDDVGYNANLEEEAFKESTLVYYHMPLNINIFNPVGQENLFEKPSRVNSKMTYSEFFKKYMNKLQEAGELGPVNVHCARGMRAGYIAVLAAAVQHDKDLAWAVQRSGELGFPISEEKTPDVYTAFKTWLSGKDRPNKGKDEL